MWKPVAGRVTSDVPFDVRILRNVQLLLRSGNLRTLSEIGCVPAGGRRTAAEATDAVSVNGEAKNQRMRHTTLQPQFLAVLCMCAELSLHVGERQS
jgi:hypothetical protein